MSIRAHGALIFFHIKNDNVKMQVLLKKETLNDQFDLFLETIDIGDFVYVSGTCFVTKTNEKTIEANEWKILSKSIRPMPTEFYGLEDLDEKFRKRYIDILLNQDVKDMFLRKSKFWQTIRNFLIEKGFLEVETPVLESVPGGAEAKPFITHHNALDMDVYLRISPELWLKRLMVAGFSKVFEIGRIFRNEGMDAEHLQDYTQMEFYWSYADYNQGMKLVTEMYQTIAKEVYGTTKFKIKDFDIDLDGTWEIYDYVSIIEEKTGINILKTDLKTIESKLVELKIDYDKKGFNLTRAIDNLWKFCRKNVSGPGFLVNVPVMMEPLAKRSGINPDLVERFQVILAGSEVGKGFSELNDPMDQASRFEDQSKMREGGDEEAQMTDNDFVEALEYGMPPTCGFGVSERLFAFLEGKPIRETVVFPLMRQKISE
jgi:lysyl-tRNA synthetase, class II